MYNVFWFWFVLCCHKLTKIIKHTWKWNLGKIIVQPQLLNYLATPSMHNASHKIRDWIKKYYFVYLNVYILILLGVIKTLFIFLCVTLLGFKTFYIFYVQCYVNTNVFDFCTFNFSGHENVVYILFNVI